mmetsp:Transcript_25811/g.103109  ORF Transcript_25811/g.103109 Transcript_25811/m.103109 type:complete len:255 (+) Transcript_25811:682-1446(+)
MHTSRIRAEPRQHADLKREVGPRYDGEVQARAHDLAIREELHRLLLIGAGLRAIGDRQHEALGERGRLGALAVAESMVPEQLVDRIALLEDDLAIRPIPNDLYADVRRRRHLAHAHEALECREERVVVALVGRRVCNEEIVDDDGGHEQHHSVSPIEVETVVGLGAREALSQQPGPELVLPGARTLAKTVPAPLDLVQDRRAVGRLSRSEAFGRPDVDLDVAPWVGVAHVGVDEGEADVQLVELEIMQRHEHQE